MDGMAFITSLEKRNANSKKGKSGLILKVTRTQA